MFKVKKKHIGVRLFSGRKVTVLSEKLSQQELSQLAGSRATSAFLEKVPARPEAKPEVKKNKIKEVKDERTQGGEQPAPADPQSTQ